MKRVPTLTKYKKSYTQRLSNLKGKKGEKLGCYPVGLRQLTNQYLTYEQLESSRRAIARLVKPKDKLNKKNQKVLASLRKVFKRRRRKKKVAKRFLIIKSTIVDPITKKPLQVRMGKGKGGVDSYVYTARSDRILLELLKKRFKLQKLKYLFNKAAIKLPCKTKFVYNRSRKEIYYFKRFNLNIEKQKYRFYN